MDMSRYTDKLQEEATRRIKAGRKSKGMSQQDMAKAMEDFGLKIGPSAYAKLERGERALSFVEAMALVGILNISLADLIPEHHDVQDEILRQINNIKAQTLIMADSADALVREIASLRSKIHLLQADAENFSEKISVPGLRETVSAVSDAQQKMNLQDLIADLQTFSQVVDELEAQNSSFVLDARKEGWLDQDGKVIPAAGYFDGDD